MKQNKINKIIGLNAIALAALGLTACQNDLNDNFINSGNGQLASADLVRTPDVVAWSGQYTLGSSFGDTNYSIATRSDNTPVVTYEMVESKYIDREAEGDFLREWFKEGENNSHILNHDFMFHAETDIEFEMYPVYTQTSHNPQTLGIFYNDENGYHEQPLWENFNIYSDLVRWDYDVYPAVPYSKGIKVSVKKGYKFGFYIEGTNNSYEVVRYYSNSHLNDPVFVTDTWGNKVQPETTSTVHAGTFTENGETYLCFEDWTDFDYQDLIFATSKPLDIVDEDDILPDDPDTPIDPEKPEGPETPDTPGGDDNTEDVVPDLPGDNDQAVVHHDNEVEVNFSILDTHSNYDIEDLVTKLSIHVRYANDVEVKIPVPTKYFVETDDLNIVEAHYLVLEKYGSNHTSTYVVDGNTVTLTVSYEDGGVINNEPVMYIVVTTSGIKQDVIDYLMEKYDDGINFEIWNYYKFNEYDAEGNLITESKKPTSEQISELKTWLDKASIAFKNNNAPDYYINAFNDTVDNPQGAKDCTVTPTIDWISKVTDMPHLNSGSSNVIYYYTTSPDELHKR